MFKILSLYRAHALLNRDHALRLPLYYHQSPDNYILCLKLMNSIVGVAYGCVLNTHALEQ